MERLKNAIKEKIKKLVRESFLEDILLEHIHAEHNKYSRNLLKIENLNTPYTYDNDHEQQGTPVDLSSNMLFITGRFRSGSTLLWNIFRNTPGCTAYYEPFNERRWFDQSNRGTKIDNTHLGVKDYWIEYNQLQHLEEFYNENWVRHQLYMDHESSNALMLKYISELALASKGLAVLQFNRIDFRLPWLHHNFPNAKFLHIYRNPREQWCSSLVDPIRQNKNWVTNNFEDHFYLKMWAADLSMAFPPLVDWKEMHPYQLFYCVWKLSYLYGSKYSDISISLEELTIHSKKTISSIMNFSSLSPINMDKLLEIVEQPTSDKWRLYADENWFARYEIEAEMLLKTYLPKKVQ